MGEFYFVRHGQSEWNVANKICGITDIALTDRGRQDALQAAEHIKAQNLKIDMILTSPLIRAKETAMIISEKTGIPLREEPRLMEQCFGIYEGTARDAEEFRIAKMRFADRYGNGESMFMTAHRVYGLLDEITAQEDTVYLLAAHNGLARIIESYFRTMTNEEFASFGVKNAEIVRYPYTVK